MSEVAMDTDTHGVQTTRMQLNDQWVEHEVEPRTHLGDYLRDQCGVTGTHLACEHGVCGACTVMLDGEPVRSCITFAVACDQKSVRTIEGFEDDPWMAKLREAFSREHGLQCGFCTPGMLITAYDIVRRLPDADENRIRLELSGNICRCTGYVGIVRAVQSVLQDLGDNPIEQAQTGAVESKPLPESKPARPAGTMRRFDASGQAAESEQQSTQASTSSEETTATESTAARRGWTRLEDDFTLDHPADKVWAAMSDVETMASCLPGAEIDESDGYKVKGRIRVKFGPIRAAFSGSATLELDDNDRVGVLRGAGTDSISQSRAKGDIRYGIKQVGGNKTRVEVTLDHMLQGPLAQFSRSGLVKDFVSHMIADFGRNLAARLSGDTTPAEESQSQMSIMKIFFSVLWGRIKRLFGRG
jgi:carbon-monoxide dehydrogenase small subunit